MTWPPELQRYTGTPPRLPPARTGSPQTPQVISPDSSRAGALPGEVRRAGSVNSADAASHDSRSTIAGQVPAPITVPRCTRSPAFLGRITTFLTEFADHGAPLTDGTSRVRRSAASARIDSPPMTRRVSSATIPASAGSTVPARVHPYGRGSAVRDAALGVLVHRPAHPVGPVLGLVPGQRAQHPGLQPTLRGLQVDLAALDGVHRDPAVDQVHNVLKITHRSAQPVDVPDQQRGPPTLPQPVEQLLIAGAALAGVGRQVIVGQHLRIGEPECRGQLPAVGGLPLHAETGAGLVSGDPAVGDS